MSSIGPSVEFVLDGLIALTIALKKKIAINVSLFWPAKPAAADIVDTALVEARRATAGMSLDG
jgi:hypothetical protein